MFTRTLFCILVSTMLAACGTKLEQAEQAQPSQDLHKAALYDGYLGLSKMEYGEGDYQDSDFFADRALLASDDKKIEPQVISARVLPVDKLNEMAIARRKVITALYRGAAEKAPQAAAEAQVKFDCWMQEQEENFQPDDIAACRNAFDASIAKINAALSPDAAQVISDDRLVYEVFFDFDSDKLSGTASEHVQAIAEITKSYETPLVAVIGNADQVGATQYNLELSQRRANAVAKELEAAGVKILGVYASGDQAPAVANPERTPEQANRRALIVVREAKAN